MQQHRVNRTDKFLFTTAPQLAAIYPHAEEITGSCSCGSSRKKFELKKKNAAEAEWSGFGVEERDGMHFCHNWNSLLLSRGGACSFAGAALLCSRWYVENVILLLLEVQNKNFAKIAVMHATNSIKSDRRSNLSTILEIIIYEHYLLFRLAVK